MELVAVAAVADNLAIGKDGEIPWESIPADRAQYRGLVADEPVVMGRRTFESMQEDLPGRAQIIISRRLQSVDTQTARVVERVDEAINAAGELARETAYVIGGGEIYAVFFPYFDRMVLSRVPGQYDADTYFPSWEEREWSLVRVTAFDRFEREEWVRVSSEEG